MRVLILTDEVFASCERPMLTRLDIGFADEGVRVIHAVPAPLLESTPGGSPVLAGVFSQFISYSPNTLAFTRGLTVRRMVRAIEELIGPEERIGVVHVYGGAAWSLGCDLAGALGASLVLEVWRPALRERALAVHAQLKEPPLLLAPDPAIAKALDRLEITSDIRGERARGDGLPPVRCVPWGVVSPPDPPVVSFENHQISAVMVGHGADPANWAAALRGLAMLAYEGREVLIFADARAASRVGLWREARRLDLLSRLSMIEELESRRDLTLRGDMLFLPEARGEQRSITLDAMSTGMLVVAANDPANSLLQEGRTATLVNGTDPGAWLAACRRFIEEPAFAAAQGRSAHQFVRQERRASDHVRGVIQAYEWLGSNQSIPFSHKSRGALPKA
ncbi:MAG: hypothetical protein KF859_03215 [Phycisphaeraceae bacterium]|nr:hypothetical protein [Phycisphaeraceae bacterium]